MKNVSQNKKIFFKILLVAALIGALIGIYFIFKSFGLTDVTKEDVQTYVQKTGVWAPIVFIVISFLQVTFVPIPGAITILAGNYLFGAWKSFFLSYIGMMLGALFAFFLGRVFGKKLVYFLAGGEDKVETWLKRLKGKQNVVLFFMFLLPFFPDDLLCLVAGLLPLSFFGFFMMQVITRATSIAGTLFFMSGEIIPYHGWGIPVLISLGILAIVAFVLSYKYSEKIEAWFIKFKKQ